MASATTTAPVSSVAAIIPGYYTALITFLPASSRPSLGTSNASCPSVLSRTAAPEFVVAIIVESKSISVATTQARFSGHQSCGVLRVFAQVSELCGWQDD